MHFNRELNYKTSFFSIFLAFGGGQNGQKMQPSDTYTLCGLPIHAGDRLYVGNPLHIGIKRLPFFATLAAFKGQKILVREK
jgi:hypothetical protein